jgi:hypothetical protein
MVGTYQRGTKKYFFYAKNLSLKIKEKPRIVNEVGKVSEDEGHQT